MTGPEPLRLAYAAALAEGYRWHEFGDLHLLLPARPASSVLATAEPSTVGSCPTMP